MLLEVGTKLYTHNNSQCITIDRVTAKRAYYRVSDTYEEEFERDIGEKTSIRRRGSTSSWGGGQCYLETPELKKRFNRVLKEKAISVINIRELSDEQVDKILEIIKKS